MVTQDKGALFTDLINRTIAKMPPELSSWVKKEIRFGFPNKKGNVGCILTKDDLKHYEAVITLFDDLLNEKEWVQEYFLLHEIAHAKLKHTYQTDTEKENKEENEAHALAWQWWKKARTNEQIKKQRIDIEQRTGRWKNED
jgi:hypothetical protein